MSTSHAPADFESLKAFVNTVSFYKDTEEFSEPAGARDWLVEHGLLSNRPSLDDADLARVVQLREALRSALLAHHELEEDPDAVRTLDSLAGEIPMRVSFDEHGNTRLEPVADGIDEALGRLLAIVHRAVLEGTWLRMKVCPADDCRWAFYDHSKNRSAKWCSMADCGNRAKGRAYRQRQAKA
jgi:predicted RNA-binding Zn ribbon-like protein